MQSIPVDTSDFAQIREKGQVYVDKTAYLYHLVNDPNGAKLFFLSRPRRFGKSLMISTLQAIFQGRRELFDDLAIAQTDYDWKKYPVIYLNMAQCAAANGNSFEELLPVVMKAALNNAGFQYDNTLNPIGNFANALFDCQARNKQVVILIDEYDDPVAQVMDNIPRANEIRDALAPLYRQIKEMEGCVRFLMVTGVSKFTKMSIFSAMSKLTDISFMDDYATMLGFTEAELDTYYSEHIAFHAEKQGLSIDAYRQELRRMYNGYRFWRFQGEKVYNPVSINLTLAYTDPCFNSYWAQTGRASMLMNYLKRDEMLAIDPERISGVSMMDFEVTNLEHIPVNALLFQTGYLTILDYDRYAEIFTLGIPDEEVRRDCSIVMASQCANQSVNWASKIGKHLLSCEWDKFFDGLKSLYAGVAYGPTEKRVCEYSYGRCLAFLLQGQGIICQPEVTYSSSRSDMVCTHHCGIYIFELKVDQPAAIAMEQIQRKNYALPYAADQRPIWLIGLSFDSKTRLLTDCAVEKY